MVGARVGPYAHDRMIAGPFVVNVACLCNKVTRVLLVSVV